MATPRPPSYLLGAHRDLRRVRVPGREGGRKREKGGKGGRGERERARRQTEGEYAEAGPSHAGQN
eukprot:3602757-Rhodomonas_salina.2